MNKPEIVKAKMDRIIAGERVVCSDSDLDAIGRDLPDEYSVRLASVPNPAQCGTLDPYVAYLAPAALWCPECHERARAETVERTGPMLAVEPARLQAVHAVGGGPLCPVMTETGYQPALPTATKPAED